MGLRKRLGIVRSTAVDPRQSGHQTDRLDGIGDILRRARGASLLDIGTNRGLVAYEFAWHGANVVHGCDIYEPGIATAREVFATMPCQSRFVLADLLEGPGNLVRAFGSDYRSSYDIVLFLAVYQKVRDLMTADARTALLEHLASRTAKYFVFRDWITHYPEVAKQLKLSGLYQIHYSLLGPFAQSAASIWTRKNVVQFAGIEQYHDAHDIDGDAHVA